MRKVSRLLTFFFFFNDSATTEIYALSLHDALPISLPRRSPRTHARCSKACARRVSSVCSRSEEHTSELQSQSNLVCRLLLEKKKNNDYQATHLLTTKPPICYNHASAARSTTTVNCI